MSMVVTAVVAAVALETAEQSAAGVHVNPGLVIPAIDGLLHEMCCACTAVEPPTKTAPKLQKATAAARGALNRRWGVELPGLAGPPNVCDLKTIGGLTWPARILGNILGPHPISYPYLLEYHLR
jgi:hypothetical protein